MKEAVKRGSLCWKLGGAQTIPTQQRGAPDERSQWSTKLPRESSAVGAAHHGAGVARGPGGDRRRPQPTQRLQVVGALPGGGRGGLGGPRLAAAPDAARHAARLAAADPGAAAG